MCPIWRLFSEFLIARSPANGGDIAAADFDSLKNLFANESLHPGDLKSAIEQFINTRLFNPIRDFFAGNDEKQLLVKAFPVIKGGKGGGGNKADKS